MGAGIDVSPRGLMRSIQERLGDSVGLIVVGAAVQRIGRNQRTSGPVTDIANST